MGVIVNYTQIDWTDNAGAKGNAKGQVSFSVLDKILYIGVGDSVVAFQPTQNAFSGDYDDLTNPPDLTQFATNASVTAAFNGLPDFSQFLTEVAISDVDGLQAALDAGGGWMESAEITYSPNTTALVPHGKGEVPKDWHVILRCKTADAGFSVGDEIPIDWKWANAYQGVGISVNATDIRIVAMAGTQLLINPSTRTGAAMNPSSWKIVARWK